jgi:TetR/AcrR family transcriptional regulator, repressor for neighboring sulfatase
VSETAPKRARRPRTDPDAARETVLDAAEALLRAEGPSALRLGEIAARAGLSHSNVLYHFGGMKDLEARLGRRIALRLAEELAEVHRSESTADLPSAAANGRLFEVLGQPENARLVAWMLVASEPEELEPLAASIRSTCEIVASHPSFAGLSADLVFREVAESAQIAIAAALGFGLIRPWVAMAFGTPPDERVFVDRLVAAEGFRIEGFGKLLTKRQ